MACAGNPASTAPARASSHSTARVIDSASTWKNRRAAGRVSEKPNPSVPSEVYVPGTQRAIWSGTALIQSDTATTGPDRPDSTEVTYGTRGSEAGCSRFHDSQASASRRSSVQDVADHTSAATPQSVASSSWAELRREALACESWNMLHPEETPRVPYVTSALTDAAGPVVAVSDWIKAVPDQIARWVPGTFTSLGTDGFGFSDTRPAARRFFHVDAESITLAVLWELARSGAVDAGFPAQAIAKYRLDLPVSEALS